LSSKWEKLFREVGVGRPRREKKQTGEIAADAHTHTGWPKDRGGRVGQ